MSCLVFVLTADNRGVILPYLFLYLELLEDRNHLVLVTAEAGQTPSKNFKQKGFDRGSQLYRRRKSSEVKQGLVGSPRG